ncbi:MAG TPA: carboxypeptidase regulatory-like domain-containing protein, partial [Dongiaceae bacterium]|nr:carboxypeptidase regulatory-like domain-containing protein [Dongiaceae bacterium]
YVSASVAYSYTDTSGAYYLSNILVGTGNTTNSFENVFASATAYFDSASNLTVYANQVVTQDLRLLRIGYGAVVGTVRDAASTLPVPGAYVSLLGAGQTDANGHYASGLLPLNNPNVPTYEGFSVSATGYWPSSTNTTITQGATNVVDVDLLKVCTGATIVGNVVDALTQKPITNALVSVTGAVSRSDMTDTNGNFILTNLTVGTGNSPIQNTITAEAPGYNSQSKSVTIFCSATIITEFGAPQTVFGGIDGYVTNVLTGQPLTNVFVGSGFGAATHTDTNGYYTFSEVPLGANGASRVWTVTAIPDGFPQQTESVSVSSNAVSRLNFGFGRPPTALLVTASGTPNPVTVGSNLLYLVRLTNTVAEAQQVQLFDTLPPGVTFVSAVLTNSSSTNFSAPVYSNNVVTATAAEFGSNSAVALAILVTPTIAGTLTNVAAVSSSTTDLDPTGSNHTATVITTVIAPVVTNVPPTNVAVQALGPPTFNPQTGLYDQSVLFTNLSGVAAAAVRVGVLGLPSSVVLYNAAGSTNGAPYVEYDQTVAAGGGVVFLLEYYDAARESFVSTNFVATAVAAATRPAPSGTMLQLDRAAFMSEGQLTIEFASVPGKTYVVQYSASANAEQWQTAVPPIVAAGTKTQWIDSGPPKTVSPPGPPGQRFYRVVQTN